MHIADSELVRQLALSSEQHAALKGRAELLLQAGDWERALVMLEMLHALDRGDAAVSLAAIEVLIELGRSDAAWQKLAELRQRAPESLELQVAQAELHLVLGDVQAAAALLRDLEARDPHGHSQAAKRARQVACAAHARYR
jgi:predicted Zn-dependent protease